MKRYFCLLAWLCPLLATAQGAPAALTVGDTLPDLALPGMIRYPQPAARLSEFRGKVVILDFFATWCGSCIRELPRLDSLQRAFGGKVQVLLVAHEPPETLQALRRRNQLFAASTLPIAASDTVLNRLFPHQLLPHQVWIDTAGRVAAITEARHLTLSNLQALLSGEKLTVPLKRDVLDFDREKPLLAQPSLAATGRILTQSLITRRLEGLFSGGGSALGADSTTRREYYINRPLLALLATALARPFDNRWVLEVPNPGWYLGEGAEPEAFCYELVLPRTAGREAARRTMLRDLEHSFSLEVRTETRVVPCLVLVSRGAARLRSRGGPPAFSPYSAADPRILLRHRPLSVLVKELNAQPFGAALRPVVLDETGYTAPVDLELRAAPGDTDALRRELQRNGLDLVAAERAVAVVVLRPACAPDP